MLEQEPEIGRKPLPLPAIIGLYVLFSLCACGAGLVALNFIGNIGGGAGAADGSSVGAESLAYEIVYNGTAAERSTVERMQVRQLDEATERYAVLMQYQLVDGAHLQLVVAQDGPDGFVALPVVAEVAIADEHLTAVARYDPNKFDSDVAVYGQILDSEITRVAVFWPGDSEISAEASLIDNTLLLFLPWNPIDGTGLPANLIAYDANDEAVTVLTWSRSAE